MLCGDRLQWYDLSVEVHGSLPIGSKVSSGGHTDGQTAWRYYKPQFPFLVKENRLTRHKHDLCMPYLFIIKVVTMRGSSYSVLFYLAFKFKS